MEKYSVGRDIDTKINKVLLINPPYTFATYLNIDRNAGTMQHPIISLASIAGALKATCEVKILDFDIIETNHLAILTDEIKKFGPDMVGITATTPVFPSMLKIAFQVKNINKRILVVAGGVHVSINPDDALNSENIDIVAVGESDFFIKNFIESRERLNLKGAYFKDNGNVVFNGKADLITNLDSLPYPDWGLYDLKKYRASRLIERNSPGGLLETSRGCPFLCDYCCKTIFGPLWRKKSVERVIAEFKYMKEAGFKEIHIEDDGFSTDLKRAKNICKEIIKNKIDIPWTLLNGVRVDRVDGELFDLLKQAGCYQITFGIESGDDEVLRKISKGITVRQIEDAVKLADRAGLEIFGCFMFGLTGDTRNSMQKTIELAKRLPITIAKFGITIPYPGTAMFKELDDDKRILHKKWGDYLMHNNKTPVFMHPNLEWDVIQTYYKKAYREFYFRPVQLCKQFVGSIKNRTFLDKLVYLLRTKWF